RNQLELVAVEHQRSRCVAPYAELRLHQRVLLADIEVELDGIDEESGRRVVLEMDGLRLGFAHRPTVPQTDAPARPRAPAKCRFRAAGLLSGASAHGTRFAQRIPKCFKLAP